MANETLAALYGFSPGAVFSAEFSNASFENIVFEIIAYAMFLLEQMFDQHKKEVDLTISEQQSGTKNWYKNKALDFQYGYALIDDTDKYDNTALTQEQIEASKIVKYCSVKESIESNRLVVKIASEANSVLEPLTTDQLESFTAYIEEIKYAGVKVSVVNNPADVLIFDLVVYRDPLVLDASGMSVSNGTKPVEVRITSYMKELPFNGELVLNDLIEQLRLIEGVNNVYINAASSSSYDGVGFSDFTFFNVARIPEAGYFKVENFNNVSYS